MSRTRLAPPHPAQLTSPTVTTGCEPEPRIRHSLAWAQSRGAAIAKGRFNKPVEFGYKVQVVDNEDGVVVDFTIELGNPAEAP